MPTLLEKLNATPREFVQILLAKTYVLRPEEFNYAGWIMEWDRTHECGSVCCLLGWFPRFFPEHFNWRTFNPSTVYHNKEVMLGIDKDLAVALFYGDGYTGPNGKAGPIAEDSPLEVVQLHLANILETL